VLLKYLTNFASSGRVWSIFYIWVSFAKCHAIPGQG